MRLIMWVLMLVIIVAGVGFAALNAGEVSINFLLTRYDLPLALLLAFVFGLGLLLGLLFSLVVYLKLKRESSRLKKQIKAIRKEVENLRSIPLKS